MVTKHILVDYLRTRVSATPGPISHLAALTYTQLPPDWDQPDAPRRQLVDSTQLDSITAAISTQIRFDLAPARDNLSTPPEFVLKNLRRTNQTVDNVSFRVTEISDRADALSREQAKLISILRHQIRSEIIGGAGSGKTSLALLKASTLTQAGKKVALMRYSRGLGRPLQLFTTHWPEEDRPAYVGLFHDLPISWGAAPGSDDDSDYWEHNLPLQLKDLTDERPRTSLFDAVVNDEGRTSAFCGGMRSSGVCATQNRLLPASPISVSNRPSPAIGPVRRSSAVRSSDCRGRRRNSS